MYWDDLKFKPSLVPTVAMLVMVSITAYLGTWQLNKAKAKAELQRRYDEATSALATPIPLGRIEPQAALYRRYALHGTFEKRGQIFLDNKVHKGKVGFHVITPMKLPNSELRVLVNRGWVSAGMNRHVLPTVTTPDQALEIVGTAYIPSKKIFELSQETVSGPVWQNLVLERYSQAFGFPLQGFVIHQENDTGDGLIREWVRPDTGRTMHLGYAFQWYALSGVLIVIYVVLNVKRKA